ncbi:RNA polymerase sigma factor [Ktedonospora formicarum]|uniref:RNA polymerase sigma-H factor n=1 Tax=Ktedonospora formicarum TaxID=2778364 RepID=A0A8J3MTT0_9CHLR|nr:RNA polymerase sigma factor [Ktedonospora formicarum]GHO44705.1 RNA polymerase sigma-H factor [Ktedonospora formicarum]
MHPSELSAEEELTIVTRIQQGETEAFHYLVTYYEPLLLPYLLQMLGNIDNARDTLQDTFLTIYQELPRWQPITAPARIPKRPLAPWIYRIATNKALSLLRKRSRRVSRSNTNSAEAMNFPAQEHMSMEERYMTRELLRMALLKLSADDAVCLIAHFVNGERYGDIATRFGLSNEAVRKRIQRALIVLRKAYHELGMETHR